MSVNYKFNALLNIYRQDITMLAKSQNSASRQQHGFEEFQHEEEHELLLAKNQSLHSQSSDKQLNIEPGGYTSQAPIQSTREGQTQQAGPKFSDLHPAQEKIVKQGALQFDIKLGWVPKSQITGPIPISLTHPDMDDIITQFVPISSLIYLGYRPTNSFDLHRNYYKNGQNYAFNQFHLCKSQFLQRFFKKYYSQFQFNAQRQHGMIMQDSPLQFDSFFQGGNLDCAYYEDQTYKLLTRVDSNTRGHCSYYYFKVRCKEIGTYRFKFVNLSKSKSLYQRGMRPFVRSRSIPQWKQMGNNVRYGQSEINELYEAKCRMYSLKFEYQFTLLDETVEFCYGIPFVYSELMKSLESYRRNPSFHLNKLCFSLSGVQVPLVTIVQNSKHEEDSKGKYVIAISARVHPGETHGSHIVNGLIQSLLKNSPEAVALRKNIIFKIIPMINPDGVIMGNTRTSLSGKDLNRVYSDKIDFVFPEIIAIRDFTKKLAQKYKQRFLFFIDIHGHSTRKNSFFYGPEYAVFDEEYTKCRLLPKIYASITEIFRYYSCKFRLSSFKEKTCRGYFNSNNIVRTYTFETSMHSYYNFETRQDEPFDQAKLEGLGRALMLALHKYITIHIGVQDRSAVQAEIKHIQPKVQKVFKKSPQKLNREENEEDDSEQMGSDKADSQQEGEDLNKNQLSIFYNKINQNKEYFFQELMAFNKMPYQKLQKKMKKQEASQQSIVFQDETTQKEQALVTKPDQSKKAKAKSDWIPSFESTLRKREFLQYQKITNIVITSKQLKQRTPDRPQKKYKLNFVRKNVHMAIQTNTENTDSPILNMKATSKARFFNKKGQQTQDKVDDHRASSKQNRELPLFKKYMQQQEIEKLILEPKPLGMLSQSWSKKTLKEQNPRYRRQSLRSTSLKLLPNKKNLKNHYSPLDKLAKKVLKSMNTKGLATRLPQIEKVISKV